MLIHFTKTIEALDSITRNGFLYLHNETGVLGPAIQQSFGIEDADCQSNGMVCFTELSPDDTFDHQLKYGRFGVGVSKNWLIGRGAKKVTYVEIGGSSYNNLVGKLSAVAPKYLYGVSTKDYLANSRTRSIGIQALTSDNWAKDSGADDEYVELLNYLAWTQTDIDIADKEWRVRNPRPFRVVGRASRMEQVELMLSSVSNPNVPDEFDGLIKSTINGSIELACTGRLSLVLPLPKEVIQAIFCPVEFAGIIQSALVNSQLSHIPIYSSVS